MDDDILKEVVSHLAPLIQIYGIYVIFHGHLTPGGGFSGGVVLALSMVLFILIFGQRAGKSMLIYTGDGCTRSWKRHLVGIGLLMNMNARLPLGLVVGILVIGLKMLSFFSHGVVKVPLGTPGSLFSSGLIVIITLGVGFVVASTMLTLFLLLVEEGPHERKSAR